MLRDATRQAAEDLENLKIMKPDRPEVAVLKHELRESLARHHDSLAKEARSKSEHAKQSSAHHHRELTKIKKDRQRSRRKSHSRQGAATSWGAVKLDVSPQLGRAYSIPGASWRFQTDVYGLHCAVAQKSRQRVQVIRPNKPEAHDEGPRLLPLPDKVEHQDTKFQHYMKLADLALQTGPAKRKQSGN